MAHIVRASGPNGNRMSYFKLDQYPLFQSGESPLMLTAGAPPYETSIPYPS